jgi:hypothetical protein
MSGIQHQGSVISSVLIGGREVAGDSSQVDRVLHGIVQCKKGRLRIR